MAASRPAIWAESLDIVTALVAVVVVVVVGD